MTHDLVAIGLCMLALLGSLRLLSRARRTVYREVYPNAPPVDLILGSVGTVNAAPLEMPDLLLQGIEVDRTNDQLVLHATWVAAHRPSLAIYECPRCEP